MARYQYRIGGQLRWMSSSGNAILAIVNPNGSGRKLTFHGFELAPLAAPAANAVTWANSTDRGRYRLGRGTVSGGILASPIKLDTDASAWPSTVRVVTQATVTSPEVPVRTISSHISLQSGQSNFANYARQQTLPTLLGSFFRKRKDSAVEGLVVRAGEGVALYPGADPEFRRTVPIKVCATLVRSGSPNRTYHVEYITFVHANNGAIFGIENQAGSGETIILRDIGVTEIGDTTTPYFQLVPVGAVLEGQATDQIVVQKMDSAFPDPSSWMTVYADAAILPFGMPENALADSSGGTPKNFNYLKTKDFLGPTYRTYFPEVIVNTGMSATLPDTLSGAGQHHLHDPFVRKSGITVRPGEGIALVSAAETATGSSGATIAGWSPYDIGVTVDIEQEFQPTLYLTGLKNPTEVRIFEAGTTTEVAGQENVTSGTFSWVFDPAETPSVDISVLALNYQNIRLTSFALSSADVTIPIQQQVDRQYANP